MLNNYLGNENELLGKAADVTASGALSEVVDIRDYTGVAAIVLASAGITDTDGTKSPTATVKLQEASDTAFSSDTGDISGATFTAISDSTASEQVIALDLQDVNERYIRAYCTVADETNATATLSVTGLFPKRGW